MKKPILFGMFLFLWSAIVPAKAQTPTPTPVNACVFSTGWAPPTFGAPQGIAVDPVRQRVYVVDSSLETLKALGYNGTLVSSFGGGTGAVPIPGVFAVAVGTCAFDGVYAVQRTSTTASVFHFDATGALRWTSPPLPTSAQRAICLNEAGDIFVAGDVNGILVLYSNGTLATSIPDAGSLGAFGAPTGVWAKGLDLYVADTLNKRIVHLVESAAGSYSYSPVGAVTLTHDPYGITQDLAGHFYVTFQNDNAYQVFDSAFNPLSDFCVQGALQYAFGVAVDERGSVYIAPSSQSAPAKLRACFTQPAFSPCAETYFGSDPPASGQGFIYPSPARGGQASLAYSMEEPGEMSLRIWNQNGEWRAEVKEHKPAGTQNTAFSISGWAPGIYFYIVTLRYDSGQSRAVPVQKFAVIH